MNSEHRHELEKNELAATVQNFWVRAKNGTLVSPRVMGYTIAVLLILGLWWYLAGSGKTAASAQWRDLEQIHTKTDLENFASSKSSAETGKIAQLQLARIKFGPEGILRLNSRNPEVRDKAISSLDEVKGELVKLADEFKKDPTLRAQCLDMAAKAEVALVGIPKSPGSTEFKGSVAAAVAHVKAIAETVGKDTAAGKAALKRAADLEKNRDEVVSLGKELETELTPAPVLNPIKVPEGSGLGNPTAPKGTGMTLPPGISPSTVPPPSPSPAPSTTPPTAPAPGTIPPPPAAPAPGTTPPTAPAKGTTPPTAAKTPPAAAAAGGAAASTPAAPTKKQ